MAERTIVTGSREKKYIQYDDDSILLIDQSSGYTHLGRVYGGGLKNDDGTVSRPKYSTVIRLKKGDPVDEKKKTLVERAIKKILDSKNGGKDIKADLKCLRDGDNEGKDFYKGYWIISCSETDDRPPVLRGPNGERIDRSKMGEVAIDNMFQGGHDYTVWFNLWSSDKKGFRVNAGLRAVQLVRKGDEVISGGGSVADTDVDDVFGLQAGDTGFDPVSDDEL